MKSAIHPTYFPQATVKCACGNTFTTGSTQEEIHVEVCSKCHPFFTGQMRYVDTAGRVDKFKARMNAAPKTQVSKRDKRALKKQRKVEEELSRPKSLSELNS